MMRSLFVVLTVSVIATVAGCNLIGGADSTPGGGSSIAASPNDGYAYFPALVDTTVDSPFELVDGNLFASGEYINGVIKVKSNATVNHGFIKCTYSYHDAAGQRLDYDMTYLDGSTLMTSTGTYTGTSLRPAEYGYVNLIDNTSGFFSINDVARVDLSFEWAAYGFVEPALTLEQTSEPAIGPNEISGSLRNPTTASVESSLSLLVAWNADGVYQDWAYVSLDDYTTDADEAVIAPGASRNWTESYIANLDAVTGADLMLDWEPYTASSSVMSRAAFATSSETDPDARALELNEARDAREAYAEVAAGP